MKHKQAIVELAMFHVKRRFFVVFDVPRETLRITKATVLMQNTLTALIVSRETEIFCRSGVPRETLCVTEVTALTQKHFDRTRCFT